MKAEFGACFLLKIMNIIDMIEMTMGEDDVFNIKPLALNNIHYLPGVHAAVDHDAFLVIGENRGVGIKYTILKNIKCHIHILSRRARRFSYCPEEGLQAVIYKVYLHHA